MTAGESTSGDGNLQSIAVIIPVRDRRLLIERALRSVLNQSYQPAQIIVVDDGSTDGSGEVVSQLFPQIDIIFSAAKGVSHARNLGLDRARADWIALLDSDDVWHSNKLQRQMERISHEPAARVVHCDEIWIRDGVRVNPMRKHAKPGGSIYRKCLPLCCMSPSATMIHASVFADVGGFDESMPACEDYDLWLRIAARYRVHYVDEKLLTRYGGHADQLSATVPAQDQYRLRALDKMLSGDVLDDDDWNATLECFAGKVKIYANGAQKRGRINEASDWRRRLRKYQQLARVNYGNGTATAVATAPEQP